MFKIKKYLKGCIRCGIIPFFKYNFFSPNIKRKDGCFFFPMRGSIIRIHPSARLSLDGDFLFNAEKYKGSRAESYLVLDKDSEMHIGADTRINYGSTLHLCKGAKLVAGSFTTNVGINFQIVKKLTIGKDCMFGRNTTIFDSAFHPTGSTPESMRINTKEVVIGDHVWIGAYSFISAGTTIDDGSMVGSCAYISGSITKATTIVRSPDSPAMVGYMWARSECAGDIEKAAGYYNLKRVVTEIDTAAAEKYSNAIIEELQPDFPTVDFVNERALISEHVLDSLSLINIVAILKKRFSISIPYYEITSSNFDSIDAMASLINRQTTSKTTKSLPQKNSYQYLPHHNQYETVRKNTLIEYVKEHAEKNPNKIAVFSEGKIFSYAELYRYVLQYGSFLKTKGLDRGDRVVVKSMQSIDYIIIYLSVHYAGGVITTVEKSTSNEKILEIAKIVEAKLVICDDDRLLESYIHVNSHSVFHDLQNQEIIDIQFPQKDDSADILFTTGTTGESKGVELSHAAVIAGAENIAAGCAMTRETVLVVPNPLNHSNAIKNMAACFITGCSFYVLDGMTDLKAYFDALDCDYGKVATVLPPAAIRTLFQLAKDKLGEYVDKLDYLMAAMAPLLEPDRDALRKLLPHTRLYNHYGCSESSSICIYDFNKYSSLRNCVGKAMPHSKVFFVDENKKEIVSSPNNIGLLAVRGDATMKGYFKAPELTSEIKNGDIIYTKDMGYMDQEGFVFILGRNDDIINVGGLKVSPLEVEAAASAYDGTADCICIGIKDDISGQALKLLIVPGESFELDVLRKVLSSKLDSYKIPRQIEIVDKIERTFNGKLNRKAYKDSDKSTARNKN